jgi:hypothetical protein
VKGVESSKSQASHIMLKSSKNISISGCYFHDAFTYDGTSTAGYGVNMIQHNSDCIVENCVFKHLRHSMVAKQGANGNVFAYNYSFDPFRSEFRMMPAAICCCMVIILSQIYLKATLDKVSLLTIPGEQQDPTILFSGTGWICMALFCLINQ